jgi:hypothetical protein
MSGRLGGVRVVILPNRDYAEGDQVNGHTHALFFQDGSTSAPRPATAERATAEKREPRPRQDTPPVNAPWSGSRAVRLDGRTLVSHPGAAAMPDPEQKHDPGCR